MQKKNKEKKKEKRRKTENNMGIDKQSSVEQR